MDEEVGELRFERLGGFRVCEVAAELVASLSDRMRNAVDELTNAALAFALITVNTGFSEILGHRDVGRELAPAFRHLRALELEHHRAVGVRNLAVAEHILDRLERLLARRRQSSLDRETARLLRDLGPTRSFNLQIARHSPSF